MTVTRPEAGVTAGLRLRRTAREEGLAPALTALLDELGPGALDSASGYAVLPQDAVPAGADILRRHPLPGGAVLLVRRAGDPAGPPPGAGRALLEIRLGLAQWLRETCVAHLSARPSGESTVLMHQMVKGQVAEAFAHQLEIGALLEAGADGLPPRHLHAELTATGRALLRLLGAHGFLAGGPGAVAQVSELLADIHTEAGEAR